MTGAGRNSSQIFFRVKAPLEKYIGKAMCVLLFDVFNGNSSSVKEINR